MRRYNFLQQDDVFESFNKLRNAFLAAKNGEEVDKILNGLLTLDERIKIGRRILVAEYIIAGVKIEEISTILSVGKNTIASVSRALSENPECFKLIEERGKKVESEYKRKSHRMVGASTMILKRREYTGFKRKNVKR